MVCFRAWESLYEILISFALIFNEVSGDYVSIDR